MKIFSGRQGEKGQWKGGGRCRKASEGVGKSGGKIHCRNRNGKSGERHFYGEKGVSGRMFSPFTSGRSGRVNGEDELDLFSEPIEAQRR